MLTIGLAGVRYPLEDDLDIVVLQLERVGGVPTVLGDFPLDWLVTRRGLRDELLRELQNWISF